MSRGIGDLVTMPLPTEWGPKRQYAPLVFPDGRQVVGSNRNGTVLVKNPDGTKSVVHHPDGAGNSIIGANGSGQLFLRGPDGGVYVVNTTPGSSVPLTPEQYYGGTGMNPSQYGTPGAVVGGGFSPEVWPTLSIPGQGIAQHGGQLMDPPIVLPDSMLPPALRRDNGPQTYQYRKNQYDAALQREADLWKWVACHGGLKSCCQIPELGAPIYDQPPFTVEPANSEKLEKMFAQPITAFQTDPTGTPADFTFTGVDVVLGSFRVPIGYDGILNRLVFGFTGDGFIDFSGDIIWRVLVNGRYVRNMGKVINTYGSFQTAFVVPGSDNIQLVSGQTVKLIANIPVDSPVSGGSVTAGSFGYFWPRR